MQRNTVRITSLLLLLTLLLTACTAVAPAAPAAAPAGEQATALRRQKVCRRTAVEVPADQKATKPWRIAFIPQLIGIPYFTAMEQGGNDAAKAFGVEYMNVGSPTASAAEQVRLMENLIQQKVDAISISVLDSQSLNPVMERAEQAGIKVYTSDSDSPDSVRDVYVAQALDEELGATLIDRLAAQIGEVGPDRHRLRRVDGYQPQHLDRLHEEAG